MGTNRLAVRLIARVPRNDGTVKENLEQSNVKNVVMWRGGAVGGVVTPKESDLLVVDLGAHDAELAAPCTRGQAQLEEAPRNEPLHGSRVNPQKGR